MKNQTNLVQKLRDEIVLLKENTSGLHELIDQIRKEKEELTRDLNSVNYLLDRLVDVAAERGKENKQLRKKIKKFKRGNNG